MHKSTHKKHQAVYLVLELFARILYKFTQTQFLKPAKGFGASWNKNFSGKNWTSFWIGIQNKPTM